MVAAAGPVPGTGRADARNLERDAARSVLLARVFAALAFLLLILWPFAEPSMAEFVQITGDVAIACFLVTGAVILARRSRQAYIRAERAHRVDAEEAARHDELSGLYNLRFLREQLHSEVVRAARDGGTLSLVLIDLDNFKDMNDRFGHMAGDDCISAIGAALNRAVGTHGIAARQGGDEFALLLPGTDRAAAEHMAGSLVEAIAAISLDAVPNNTHLQVSASLGTASYPQDGADAQSLLAAADRALYRAKARVEEAHSRRAERSSQDVFFALGEAIGESADPAQVVENLCRAVGKRLDLDMCAIYLLGDDARYELHAAYANHPGEEARIRAAFQADPFRRDEVFARGLVGSRVVYLDDAPNSEALPDRFRGVLPPGSWVVTVPLPAPPEGVLVMRSRHERTSPPESGLALAIAQLGGASLRNADTYRRARERADQLAALAGIAGRLVGDGNFRERLDGITRAIVEVTGFDLVTLDALNPAGAGEHVRSFFRRGNGAREGDHRRGGNWQGMQPALHEPAIAPRLEALTEPVLLTDPRREVPAPYREVVERHGIRTVCVVPVTWQGCLKGVFFFASYRPDAFDEHDVALMSTIAAKIAPSLQVAALHHELETSYEHLKGAHLHALLRLAYAAEARDPYTECHLQRIRAVAQAIGRRMGMPEDELEAMGYGAIVHDLGKLRIPDSVLVNPGSLSDEEWALMKKHPEWGAEIIGDNEFYAVARQVALHHHERWDGSGYPHGLAGEAIPLAARVVAVADVYDALTSARPYKAAWTAERALVELMKMRGHTLCPRSVDVFMDLWREGDIQRIDEETAGESMEFDFRSFYAA